MMLVKLALLGALAGASARSVAPLARGCAGFVAPRAGAYRVSVLLGGAHVAGSPFAVRATAALRKDTGPPTAASPPAFEEGEEY